MKEEKDFIKVVVTAAIGLCEGCAFNDGVTIKCHRPDEFTDCWDDKDNDYIFKESEQ